MSPHAGFEMIARLLAVVACVQSLEFLKLAPATRESGVWRWSFIERELGGTRRILRAFFRFFLADDRFRILNVVRILVALNLLFVPNPIGMAILLFFHVLTILRWLGTFNGGSDYMTLLLLWTGTLGLSIGGKTEIALLWYVSFHLCLSYFKAGWLKLKNPKWRNGEAFYAFVNSPVYEATALSRAITGTSFLNVLGGWSIIVFEVIFPIGLFDSRLAIILMAVAAMFHLVNVYIFGLNRFFFAWIAAYPAFYYCSLWAKSVSLPR